MRPIRTLAAAAVACSGLLFALPAASAGMPGGTHVGTPHYGDGLLLAQGGAGPGGYRYNPQYGPRPGDRSRDRYGDGYHQQYAQPPRDRDRYRWDYDHHKRWKTQRHPRWSYWKGRRLPPHGRYYVVRDYGAYHLPRPPRGYYYVRDNDDVFLVLETTRTIVDAFVLFQLLNR